jgi:hypothetical protein
VIKQNGVWLDIDHILRKSGRVIDLRLFRTVEFVQVVGDFKYQPQTFGKQGLENVVQPVAEFG